MIKLNDNNIFVGYIKELLNDFNLPRVRFDMDHPFNGCHYLKGNQLYSCSDNKLVQVNTYKYGDKLLNITKNFQIRNNIYDNETHTYLGDYLRFQRDYLGLDLMSLYNCCGYESPTNYSVDINIVKDEKTIYTDIFDSSNNQYKIYIIPVKFNQKYTIGIDCSTSITCMCDFYLNGERIILSEGSGNICNSTYKKFTGLKLSKPFNKQKPILFETPSIDQNNYMLEPALKLMIKIPVQCESSLVVLEGDYTEGCNIIIDEAGKSILANQLFTYKVNNKELGNFNYTSRPSLLAINTREKILLADRLVEYLLFNVIALNSDSANIEKAQSRLNRNGTGRYHKKYLDYVTHYGSWSLDIKKALYKFISDNNLNSQYYDVLSYIDKDIERELGGIE